MNQRLTDIGLSNMGLKFQFLIVSVDFKIETSLCDLRHALKESQKNTQSQHLDCNCGAFWSQGHISGVKLPQGRKWS